MCPPRPSPRAFVLALALAGASPAAAATFVKADNDLPLNSPASWTLNSLPGTADTALFDATITAPLTVSLGGNLGVTSLKVSNPAGPLTLTGANTLTLGGSGGFDMLTATTSLTIHAPVTDAYAVAQNWTVPTLLTLHGNFAASSGNSARGINLSGGGTLTFGGTSNFLFPYVPFATAVTTSTFKVAAPAALNFGGNNFALNNAASTLDLAGNNALIGSLTGLGSVTSTSASPATLTLRPNTPNTLTFSGTITAGAAPLSLAIAGDGLQRFVSAQSYSGTTTLARGTLTLDFSAPSAPASNIISPASALVMSGGMLNLVSSAGANTAQSFSHTTIAPGASTFSLTLATASSFAPTLSLGTMSRTAAGGTVRFLHPFNSTNAQFLTTTPLAAGILGGWAITTGDWATTDAAGRIIPLPAASYVSASTGAGSFAPGLHTNLDTTLDLSTAAPDLHTETLRYNAPTSSTLTLHGHNIIDSGGILIASGLVASNVLTIAGGASLSSGNGRDLIIHASNTKANLAIASPIADHAGSPIALTLSLEHSTLTLSANNTYSAGTFLHHGILTLHSGSSLGSGAVTLARAPGKTTLLRLPDGFSLPNAISLERDDALFSGSMIDVAAGSSATLAGNVSAPAGPANAYRLGTSGGTLTLTGQHTSGSPLAGSTAPITTAFWGASRTNAASQPPTSRILFAGNSSLTAYQSPIFLSYVDLVLRDNASLSVLNPSTTFGLRMGAGNTFANYQGANILTLQDNAHLNLAALSLDLNNNPSFGDSFLNLHGGSLTLGQFVKTSAALPATILLNGTTLRAGRDSAAFLPSTLASVTALVHVRGAHIHTNAFDITLSLPLQHNGAMGPTPDGGLTKSGPGTLTLASPGSTYTGPTTVHEGTLLFAASRNTPLRGLFGNGTAAIAPDAAITSSGPVQVRHLVINGTLSVSPGNAPNSATTVQSLAIARAGDTFTGLLSMPYGDLVITSDSPAEKLAKISDLQAALRAGYNNGTWNGKGITISTAAFDPAHLAAALFDNADLRLPSLRGTPLSDHDLFITTAPIGDANNDARVDAFDLNILAAHWQQPAGATASSGDFTRDGIVNAFDLNALASNWQYGSLSTLSFAAALTPFPLLAPTLIPEPASLLMLAPTLLLLRRRPRPAGHSEKSQPRRQRHPPQ